MCDFCQIGPEITDLRFFLDFLEKRFKTILSSSFDDQKLRHSLECPVLNPSSIGSNLVDFLVDSVLFEFC